MKLEDFESRMVHDGKRNNREVLVSCKRCGKQTWKRWQRVKSGGGEFCTLECFNEFQVEEGRKLWGKENANFHWDGNRLCWYAYWQNKETGIRETTTKSKWLWEKNYGEVPDGYVVTYKDRNPKNCELENLEIVTRGERTSEALMGHEVSKETRKKISIAHTGKKKWDGLVKDKSYTGFSKHVKRKVRERDNYECQICGYNLKRSSRSRIHHINGDKHNSSMENLVLVCNKCHSLIHCRKEVGDKILAFRSLLE